MKLRSIITGKVLRSAASAIISFGLCAPSAFAASPRQEPAGVRAIGMGGAFTAVASDASAAHWNPAALASLQRQEIGLAYADRFGLGLNHSYINYVLPVGDHHAIGLDWLHLGFDDSELNTGQNKLAFAYGYRNGIERLRPYIGNAAIGLSGKYR